MRPFAEGRNWLFFDQSTGAEASTSFYTIIETAKANGLEPMHSCDSHSLASSISAPTSGPWEDLLPTSEIRAFAESIGILYSMGL